MQLKNLIASVCALCGFAISAAAETVEYWDPVGKVAKSVEATVVTSDTGTLGSGWYVVKGSVSRTGCISVSDTANLILADGAVLIVTVNGEDDPGIRVESGKTLNIYAQSIGVNTMGRLSATSGKYGAGIGGGKWNEGGTVNIFGGGGGGGGDVTISGGTVVAKAGSSEVWDVGSGWGGGDSGEFIVTGGSVHLANSSKCRAGYPQNVAEAQLYCVTVEDLEGLVSLEDLDGYGTDGIFADADGKIYLYLPNGTYSFTANDVSYAATVANGSTTAVAQ